MKLKPSILFPAAVTAFALAGSFGLGAAIAPSRPAFSPSGARDTVIYPVAAYRYAHYDDSAIEIDSLNVDETAETADTAVQTKLSPRDSLKALLDSTLWDKVDSIYIADSTAKAKAAFEAWYSSLSRKERREYDAEQRMNRKIARADSLRLEKEKRQETRDSIIENTPRILETFALPDSLHYKRIVSWTTDQDFHDISAYIPDTTFNYHYYDYPFLRRDVNATWLGVAGSPLQYYNFFERKSDEGVDFYNALEPWSFSPRTLPNYNSKTPYTELSYFGTLLSDDAKESDNLHILTTQNITPELNFGILFDRFGGGGMLENEETINKTFAVNTNYLGKKYMMHAGYIYNMVSRDENGGMTDDTFIRDTSLDARDIRVNLTNAHSRLKKHTFYLEQQLRIPFTFIERMRARRDSTYNFNADSLNRDITTAYIGHSSEISTYTRTYTDVINDEAGQAFYNNIFYYNPTTSADSMRVRKIDNKVFLRLQPWASDAIVSKLDIGLGDYVRTYFDSTATRPLNRIENSIYAYAGARGQFRNNFYWDAKAKYVFAGNDAGDFNLEGGGRLALYPFRRNRHSPATLDVRIATSLQEPTWYQKHMSSNHFKWDNDFTKISTTTLTGSIGIPNWKLDVSAGYALLSGNLYYDTAGIIRQNSVPMSVLSLSLDKEFVLGPVHLDNRILVQHSTDQQVLPLPSVAMNLRYYLQFVAQKSEDGRENVLVMQIGANAFWNTSWHSPAWNPNLGVFYNQDQRLYNNGPFFDIFINMQWKRACIFIKYQNAGLGWPMRRSDYFSADRYIVTQSGMDGLKIGIWWPFYTQPTGRPRK